MHQDDSIAHHVRKHVHLSAAITIVVVVVVLILGYIFLLRPAMQGYQVYTQLETNNVPIESVISDYSDVKSQLASANQNITTYKLVIEQMLAVNNAVNSTLESFASKSAQCIADYTQLKATMQTTLNQKNSELIDQEDKLTELQTRYNMLASTSARSICCKQKVDDDSVDSYSLTNNRISCGTGLENGLVC